MASFKVPSLSFSLFLGPSGKNMFVHWQTDVLLFIHGRHV